MDKNKVEFEPPDGGYGWVIVVASGLNYFITSSLIQVFGLIYTDIFEDLGLSATQESFITDSNSAFAMLTGLITGPLLNHFGYRKVTYLGSSLTFIGLFSLSFATDMTGYLFSYGFVASIGVGLTTSSYSLAVYTYFQEKRSKAVSITMTISGLGPVIMPQIVNYLMEIYSIQNVTLILAGICAQNFIFATLLQPVEYHLKKVVGENKKLSKIEEADEDENDELADEVRNMPVIPNRKYPFVKSFSMIEHRKDSPLSMYYDQDAAGVYGIDSTLIGMSMVSLQSVKTPASPTSPLLLRQNTQTKFQWWRSASTVNLDSSYNIFDDVINQDAHGKVYNELSVKKQDESKLKIFFRGIVALFDLTLLKDPVYCNIMFGLALSVFAEVDFMLATAFILDEFGLSTGEIAEFLSILGMADIIFRFLAPYIGELVKQPPRVMYLLALTALISTRIMLIYVTNIKYIFLVAVALGCAKGVRTVYLFLVIPSYVPLERLASASGIRMIVNGLFMLIGGPLIGFVRDTTGSYKACIVILNCLTFITIFTWLIEMAIKKCLIDKIEDTTPPTTEQTNNLLS